MISKKKDNRIILTDEKFVSDDAIDDKYNNFNILLHCIVNFNRKKQYIIYTWIKIDTK